MNFRRSMIVVAMVLVAVMGMTAMAQATTPTSNDEVQKQIAALQAELKDLQRSLRRINEEGSASDQDKAQQLMERIGEIRERIAQLKEQSGSGQ